MSINVHTFSGRIGRDAETRHTGSGKSVTGFPVAVDVGYGDNKHALWIDCAMWAERGDKLAPYLLKGGIVTVSGEADLQTYKAGDGSERTKMVCRVNDVQLPPRSDNAPQQQRSPAPAPQRHAPRKADADGFDDETIPF